MRGILPPAIFPPPWLLAGPARPLPARAEGLGGISELDASKG
jgi:hypothetical protein